MPELSRFYGIVIQMYYDDHSPSHFHALYAGRMATIDIERLTFTDGELPARARGLVIEWATLHQAELREAFRRSAAMQPPARIAPPRVANGEAQCSSDSAAFAQVTLNGAIHTVVCPYAADFAPPHLDWPKHEASFRAAADRARAGGASMDAIRSGIETKPGLPLQGPVVGARRSRRFNIRKSSVSDFSRRDRTPHVEAA